MLRCMDDNCFDNATINTAADPSPGEIRGNSARHTLRVRRGNHVDLLKGLVQSARSIIRRLLRLPKQ